MALMGMWIFLASLTMFFLTSLSAYIYLRLITDIWRSPESPGLPGSLWLSTGVLLVSGGTIHKALRSAQAGSVEALWRWLSATAALGVLFLILQAVGGWWLFQAMPEQDRRTPYAFTFYMLTVLHAIHVLGGLIPLSVVTVRAHLGRYTAARHEGVQLIVMYWHFLDVIWLILFLTLLIGAVV